MPTELLPIGMPWTMIANRIYALPTARTVLVTDTPTPTITMSNTLAFTNNVAVTLTGGSAQLGGGFLKSNVDTLVELTRA